MMELFKGIKVEDRYYKGVRFVLALVPNYKGQMIYLALYRAYDTFYDEVNVYFLDMYREHKTDLMARVELDMDIERDMRCATRDK